MIHFAHYSVLSLSEILRHSKVIEVNLVAYPTGEINPGFMENRLTSETKATVGIAVQNVKQDPERWKVTCTNTYLENLSK